MESTDDKTKRYISVALLTAVIIIMSFTPLGYFRTNYASLTLLPIPVVIGAILYGPYYGTLLGLVFGVSSFIHCFGDSYTFGSELIKISPVLTAVVCIVPRVLMGLSSGWIHIFFSRNCSPVFANLVTSFGGGFLNTVFYVTALLLCFYSSDYIQSLGTTLTGIISTLITFNSSIEWVTCTVIGTLFISIRSKIWAKNNKVSE